MSHIATHRLPNAIVGVVVLFALVVALEVAGQSTRPLDVTATVASPDLVPTPTQSTTDRPSPPSPEPEEEQQDEGSNNSAPSEDEVAAEATSRRPVFEDNIVVTAQRREQSMQEVPVAISLLSGDDVKNVRFQKISDLALYVPNTDVKDALPGFAQVITIRGVGQNDFGFLNTSSVGVYLDEVHLASPGQFGLMAFDLERVEVLRGPQGTLYGRNATGGAVNLHTAKPSREREGYLTVGLGNYESAEFEGAVVQLENLKAQLEAENIQLREEVGRREGHHEIVGSSDAMPYVLHKIDQVAGKCSRAAERRRTGGPGMQ